MPALSSLPDHFNQRPTRIGSMPIIDNQYRLERDFVDSTEIQIDDSTSWALDLQKPNWKLIAPYLSFSIDYLSPSFAYHVYLWVSEQANGHPLGTKILGQIQTAPVVIDLLRSDTNFVFATHGSRRPMFRLEPGTYWVNFWYYGSNRGTYLAKQLTLLD